MGNQQYSLPLDSYAFRLYSQYKKRHQKAPCGLFRPAYRRCCGSRPPALNPLYGFPPSTLGKAGGR